MTDIKQAQLDAQEIKDELTEVIRRHYEKFEEKFPELRLNCRVDTFSVFYIDKTPIVHTSVSIK